MRSFFFCFSFEICIWKLLTRIWRDDRKSKTSFRCRVKRLTSQLCHWENAGLLRFTLVKRCFRPVMYKNQKLTQAQTHWCSYTVQPKDSPVKRRNKYVAVGKIEGISESAATIGSEETKQTVQSLLNSQLPNGGLITPLTLVFSLSFVAALSLTCSRTNGSCPLHRR